MIGRIVRSADFERVLGAPSRARTSHFAVHHLAARPSSPAKPKSKALSTGQVELSTDLAQDAHRVVDEAPLEGCWLGYVVPKRHAKRSVTRSLFKRQIRAAFASCGEALPPGLWVVRLRAPFDRKQYPSAASEALGAAARAELAQLMARLLPRPAAASPTA
ncbi:MAG TPA: ribonuclease P protein component [Burkholderiaceae bacterium]